MNREAGTYRRADIEEALARLRDAAAEAQAWPAMRWKKVAGPGPESVELVDGVFRGLALLPGEQVTLECEYALPDAVASTPLKGDALDVMVFSLYPTALSWDGRPLLDEQVPPVALGPALVRVCSDLQPDLPGELRLTISPPRNQMTTWCRLYFSTPLLRARFALLDLTWARLALAFQLAVTPVEREAVQRAAALVPARPDQMSAENLATHLRDLPQALAPLSARIGALQVHVVGHSHIDMNWLWTWSDTREVIKRDAQSVLALMDDYPEMTFTHSQPATYLVLQQEAPELFARVRARILEGRWEPATMTWVEGDTNMASGEALARQLLEGVAYSREQLGSRPNAFLAPDTFGHAGTLPQLAVSAGATVYYHHRCNPGYTSPEEMLWPAYWWEGQDGTRLLAVSTPSYNGFITAGGLAEAMIAAYRQGQTVALYFHGVGDHGGGPARRGLDRLRELQGLPAFLSAHCSTLSAYARGLLQSGVALPVHRGESATVFEGCYTTQSEVKRGNRLGENLLCTADTLAALAGLTYPDILSDAWRRLLFHQFHDILDGSAIHEAYEYSADEFRAVKAAAESVVERALDILEPAMAAAQIAVTNPLGWDRHDLVIASDMQGEGVVWLHGAAGDRTPGQFTAKGLCFVANVPAFATVVYQVGSPTENPLPAAIAAVPALAPAALAARDVAAAQATDLPYYRIDTPQFRAYMRRDAGILVSLFDKRVGREIVGYGMRRYSDYPDTARTDLALNVLQILDELPHEMSAWHLDEVLRETSLLRGAATRVVESGPVRLVVEVRHSIRSSTVTQEIAFYHDLSRIDVETTIDWRELGGTEAGVANLKVSFTARLVESEAWFESPYGAVRRPADGQEVPALRWGDVGGKEYGLAILNDSRYGYDVLGSRIRLSLVRSAYDPDAIADQGLHALRYSILPHAGDWRDAGVTRLAAGFNQPLMARAVRERSQGSLPHAVTLAWRPRLSDGSVLIACLKPAHRRNGTVIRLYESAGRMAEATLSGLPPEARLSEMNIVEDSVASVELVQGTARLFFRPWQVRTLLVEE